MVVGIWFFADYDDDTKVLILEWTMVLVEIITS